MPLSAGDKLGPYEILSPIGAGGMGEVYKARDTRLDRSVAVKVLPDHIAKKADALARFEREARSVASLNHPNICTLHDIGRQEETSYMVMELIEGETLASRIEKGPIPLDQALKLATQIADALDRAHRAGVTHRDVKPQNIMLTRDGVKVLDFGLAKSQAKPGPTEETLTKVLTTEGTVVGTPQYMAPEQFEGKEADARSDIWAFGAVLYEMVTGQKAFQGKSYASLLGAILSADPPPMTVNSLTPSWLERLIRRCLQKDPDDRYQSMRDLAIDLKSPPAESALVAAKSSRWPWALAGASTLALLVACVLLYNANRPAPPRPLMHLNVNLPPATPLERVDVAGGLGANLMALSPDGTRLVLCLRGADGIIRLHTRLLLQNELTPLAGTEGAYSPFFSPGGDWIGFFANQQMHKIAVEGGAVIKLLNGASFVSGASWGDDGNIIVALRGTLHRVPSGGGTAVQLTKLNAGEATHRWPQVLPGSQEVLFTAATLASSGYDDATIEALSLQTGERKTLHRGGFSARYLAGTTGSAGIGYLVYLHQSTLFGVPFEPRRLALAGSPAPILEDVGSTEIGGGDFTFAENGTFVYLNGKAFMGGFPISWVDSGGKMAQPLHAPLGRYTTPRFSPDGKRLAYAAGDAKQSTQIWVKDLDRDTTSRLSFTPGFNDYPVWTPDGKTIVFRSILQPANGLYAIRADGSGEAKRLTEVTQLPYSFSPDGKRLAVFQRGNSDSLDLFTLPVEADSGPGAPGIRLGKPELFLGTPFDETRPAFSPDGRWLAYESVESGKNEVYVRPFSPSREGPGGKWQVSTGGGRVPHWSRDGRELLFLALDNRVMAASITAKGEVFAAGHPRIWSDVRIRNYGYYDIAPDGRRLAAMVEDEEAGKLPTSLTVLVNFADELRQKAPRN